MSKTTLETSMVSFDGGTEHTALLWKGWIELMAEYKDGLAGALSQEYPGSAQEYGGNWKA